MEEQYIQILEKTNQQLGLLTNPYGIMVSVLSVLFTVLAIVAAVIIYRQSKDYKEKLQADREQYTKNFNEFFASQKAIIEKREKQVVEVEKDIDKLLKEYEKKLNASSEKQKAEIQKAIQKLEEEKLFLGGKIGPLTVSPNSFDFITTAYGLGNNHHNCKNCGFGFFVKNDWSTLSTLTLNRTITCPKCGSVDPV
ncbi:MAG: hypothetical protein Q8O46_04400 [bacterium]|nr:hypothetical protein [bacterium]